MVGLVLGGKWPSNIETHLGSRVFVDMLFCHCPIYSRRPLDCDSSAETSQPCLFCCVNYTIQLFRDYFISHDKNSFFTYQWLFKSDFFIKMYEKPYVSRFVFKRCSLYHVSSRETYGTFKSFSVWSTKGSPNISPWISVLSLNDTPKFKS